MPTINGVTFTELDGSCSLRASQDGMQGTRTLDCAWDDRKDAVSALLGEIVYVGTARNVLAPPDTFPGYDNLEAYDLQMEGVGLNGEDTDGGPDYDLARFTVQYKVPETDQGAQSDGDGNAGQFYDTEQVDYEQSFITIPGGSTTVGGTKALDAWVLPITLAVRNYTKKDLTAIPDLSIWLNTVNDAAWPPGRANAAAAGCLLFTGIKSTKKVNAAGLVRYDIQYTIKERNWSWNQGIDPATGAWADIAPTPFGVADFTAFAAG